MTLPMISVLTTIALISGGLLVLILLASIIGGLDLDTDIDADSDPGVGGVGLFKGGLTFLSVGSYATKVTLVASSNPVLSLIGGLATGAFAVYLLGLVLRWLLSQEENVNWSAEDAVSHSGDVYLRIPVRGEGIVRVALNGGVREFKARSEAEEAIPTGTQITVEGCTPEGVLLVRPRVANAV